MVIDPSVTLTPKAQHRRKLSKRKPGKGSRDCALTIEVRGHIVAYVHLSQVLVVLHLVIRDADALLWCCNTNAIDWHSTVLAVARTCQGSASKPANRL